MESVDHRMLGLIVASGFGCRFARGMQLAQCLHERISIELHEILDLMLIHQLVQMAA